MTNERLQQLLDAFYTGNSSPEEEAMLMRHFNESQTADKRFAADAAIFKAKGSIPKRSIPTDLEDRVLGATVGKRRNLRMRIATVAAAAACAAVVIAVGLSVGFHKASNDDKPLMAYVSLDPVSQLSTKQNAQVEWKETEVSTGKSATMPTALSVEIQEPVRTSGTATSASSNKKSKRDLAKEKAQRDTAKALAQLQESFSAAAEAVRATQVAIPDAPEINIDIKIEPIQITL